MAECFLRLPLSTAVQQRRLGGDGAVELPRVGTIILEEDLERSLGHWLSSAPRGWGRGRGRVLDGREGRLLVVGGELEVNLRQTCKRCLAMFVMEIIQLGRASLNPPELCSKWDGLNFTGRQPLKLKPPPTLITSLDPAVIFTCRRCLLALPDFVWSLVGKNH